METLHILHLHRMFDDVAAVRKLEGARDDLSMLGSYDGDEAITVHGDGTNVMSEDIKQQFGGNNTQTNYSSGGGSQNFDQRGLQHVRGDVYYISYNYSETRVPLSRPSRSIKSSNILPGHKKSKHGSGQLTLPIQDEDVLDSVLASLATFSKSLSQRIEGDEGLEISRQVSTVLKFLERFGKVENQTPVPHSVSRQISHLKRQLKHNNVVQVNAVRPQNLATRLSKARSEVFNVEFGHWKICLTTKTLKSQDVDGLSASQTSSTLHVQSLETIRRHNIATFFQERIGCEQEILMHPIISAYNQVEDSAQVFDAVRRNDLEDLVKLLQIGEASLRDCDSKCRVLLSYACFYASRDICEFLVANGADVDRFDESMSSSGKTSPLAICTEAMCAQTHKQEKNSRSLQCTRLLLQGGADPMATIWYPELDDWTGEVSQVSPYPPILKASQWGPTELVNVLMSDGAAFIDWYHEADDIESLWSMICTMPTRIPAATLPTLMAAGFDVTRVDKNGWNCLFHCVLAACQPQSGGEFETLCFFLGAFDNIFAQDGDGCSIFDRAKFKRPQASWEMRNVYSTCSADGFATTLYKMSPRRHGSYQQDLWYCALYRTGLHLRYNIPPPPSSVFTRNYTRQHYRALLYLKSWDMDEDPKSLDHPLLRQNPLSSDERQHAPALLEWDDEHLSMMERRLGSAFHVEKKSTKRSDNGGMGWVDEEDEDNNSDEEE